MYKFFLKSKNISRDAIVWNIVASTLLSGMSALLLIIVVRFLNDLDAAIFSLGFSIAQMMLTIGYFDMRAYQATDVNHEHPFTRYLTSRIITCTLMLFVSFLYVQLKQYDLYKSLIILMLCVFKMFDALEDVFHGQFQVNGRLDIASKLQTFRVVLCMLLFSITIMIFHNLLFSIIIVILISVFVLILFDIPLVSKFDTLSLDGNSKKVMQLLLTCLPLCIGSYLSLYIGNSPKYAIDTFLEPINQTYFNILFMPSYVVNLFCGFALRPLLTTLAKQYNDGYFKAYIKTIFKLVLLIIGLTIVIEIGAFLLGIPVLSIIYNLDLSPYKMELLILIFAGAISALGTLIYYALTIMRNQKLLLISYVITGISAYFVSPALVEKWHLFGASMANVVLYGLRTTIFIVIFIICFKQNTKLKKWK